MRLILIVNWVSWQAQGDVGRGVTPPSALPEVSSRGGDDTKHGQESQVTVQGAHWCGASWSPEVLPPSTEELTLKNAVLFLLGEKLVSPKRILAAPREGASTCIEKLHLRHPLSGLWEVQSTPGTGYSFQMIEKWIQRNHHKPEGFE